MLRLIGRSIRDFRKYSAKLLLFQLLYMLVTSVVILPVTTLLFNRVLRVVGSGSLLNGEVYRLGLSYKGLAGLSLIGMVASFTLLIQLLVLIVLIQQRFFGKEIAIADAVLTVLRKTPKLFGFGVFQLLLLLLLLIPFLDSPLTASFYALFNVPIFLNNQVLDASFTMTAAYIVLLAGLLYTLLRWIFVLHCIVLEDMNLRQAVRQSHILTQGRRWRLFGSLLLFNGAVLGGTSAVVSALGHIPTWLNLDVLALVSQHYSLTVSTVLAYLLELLLLPINLFVLTRLYYAFGRLRWIRAKDQLQVSRSRLGRIEKRVVVWWRGLKWKRTAYALGAAIYISLAVLIGLRANDSLVYAKWNVQIAAHRGDTSNAPENSVPALISAIDKGIQVAELDVQMTKDGVAVLNHDSDLRRMTGVRKRIADMTFAEVRQLSIGRDANGYPVHIPLLSSVLAEAQGRIKLLLDLKPNGSSSEALAEEVVRLIKEAGMEEEVRVQSFDGVALSRIRELAPEIKIGRILFFALGDLSALDVDFYTIEQIMLTDFLLNKAHADGREVWVWTVNTRRDMKEVLKYPIDGMITDIPETAQSLVEVDL
ncbi:MAG: glycerophosphodiester phosphodiesterase [Paenibacillaceae bacterium]|uniref:Glycerophosphodiester phosphodiesterase n=1 Tax=Paenibacillus mellifer TaxID=2937794 RepID=A0A9X2BUJ4_9BACL|nr:glycerophosphodiester phosphodiesterase [Paenibacillus mellifer]MBW4840211.1 glycerophosphodiester phosphodiesterase [Paenibacillaceae bacterium]MCK8489126.1 glycerophosphodiester phosphodiesterase [Paenibacillus mellifer]